MGGVIVPIHIQRPNNIDPRGVHRHQYHALLLVGGGFRVGLAHEDGNLAARVRRSACPPLVSTNNVAVSFPDKSARHDYNVHCWCLLSGWMVREGIRTVIAALLKTVCLGSAGGCRKKFVKDQLEVTENSLFKISWRPQQNKTCTALQRYCTDLQIDCVNVDGSKVCCTALKQQSGADMNDNKIKGLEQPSRELCCRACSKHLKLKEMSHERSCRLAG